MSTLCPWLVALSLSILPATSAILCFNCSSNASQTSKPCAGAFFFPQQPFNNSRQLLVKCTGENAMCFVRTWSYRDRYAWLIQRGCYQSHKNDELVSSLRTPTRAMTCKTDRHANAEQTTCLCAGDWCNLATVTVIPCFTAIVTVLFIILST